MRVNISGVPVNSTKPKPEGRIYGGTDAEIKDFPWHVKQLRCSSILLYFQIFKH
jgi:hypothetical protein